MLVALPILTPVFAAALSIALHGRLAAQRAIGLATTLALAIVGVALLWQVRTDGIQVVHISNWAAPFGITLVADLLSATLVLLVGVVGLVVALFAIDDVDADRQVHGFWPLLCVVLMGVCGAFLTGDLFNLYVWFEVTLVASFVLMTLGGTPAQLDGGLKYVALNLLGSAIFLAAVGLLYASTKTLNMADLAVRLPVLYASHPHLVQSIAVLFLVCFGLKAAMFPLFFWLPASYATPPAAVGALFAALLTKVGVYSLLRVLTLVFPVQTSGWALLLILAALTMIVGVFGAVSQYNTRRILAFHSISQVGYMLAGIGLLITPEPAVRTLALAAALIYMIHHSLVKGNLFLLSGLIEAHRGTVELKPLGGLSKATPWLAGLFLVTALSLAGVPPLSGFWAKLAVVKAGLDAGQYLLTAAALFTGVFTLISMIKIWNEAFWKSPDESTERSTSAAPVAGRPLWRRYVAAALFAALVIAIGVAPQPLFALAEDVGAQLLDRQQYIDAVNLQTAARPLAAARDILTVGEASAP